MSGLFTRANLSESGLNATEAIQKLYEPQIQNDINLFGFSTVLRSSISSASSSSDNQIIGLVNQSLSNLSGEIFFRTRFVTQDSTFTENNQVWFDKIPPNFDRRDTIIDPIRVSIDGSVAGVRVETTGTKYLVQNPDGTEVESYPATVEVNIRGVESLSSNAVVRVTVNSDGTVGRFMPVVSGGSGYIDGERLELLPKCRPGEISVRNKCEDYTLPSLAQVYFDSGSVGYGALIYNDKYRYRVRFADINGFFLYDDILDEWVYLGSFYNIPYNIPPSETPLLVLSRSDSVESENVKQLYKLNSRSYSNSYNTNFSFSIERGLNNILGSIGNAVESIKRDLPLFVQNSRVYPGDADQSNPLGSIYNIFEGFNVTSDYRLIFRDPDDVIDQPTTDFFSLRDLLDTESDYKLNGLTVPGVWIFTGQKYQRAFSSDDKPFFSTLGRKYLSPLLFDEEGTELGESGENKYSISASFLNPITSETRGFDTEIGTLIQTISSTPGLGGFVYHRTLSPTASNGIFYWPLLSYINSSGSVSEAKFLVA